MPEHVDLKRTCRLCLKSAKVENELIHIFKNDGNCSLPIRIMVCTALEVNQNDALPKNICTDCRYNLEKLYLFRRKSKNADSKLRQHLRSINLGKISNLFDDDEHQAEYEECLAFIAKCDANEENKYEMMKRQWEGKKCRWEQEKKRLQKENHELEEELENLSRKKNKEYERMLKQRKQYAMKSHFQEMSVENEPSVKATIFNNDITKIETLPAECTEVESGENIETLTVECAEVESGENIETLTVECAEVESGENIETLFVLEGTTNNSEDYEFITDDTNNYSLMFEESNESEKTDTIVRDKSNYILSANEDKIEISFAEGENGNNIDDGNYTNAEYLEINDEETQEEKIIPLQYSSISKAIRNTIASCSGISPDREGVDCKLFMLNGKSTKIAVKTDDNPDKTFFVGIQNNGKLSAYSCDICSQSYRSASKLNEHIDKVHEKKKGKNCDSCSKWFASNSALRRHIRVHTGEKPFKCHECEKQFSQKEILERHMMIHRDEKPHTCSWCGKGYAQRDMLKQHINRKHSANPVINLHKCQQCTKSSQLSTHCQEFSCEYCLKSFGDQTSMKRHVKSLHAHLLKIET